MLEGNPVLTKFVMNRVSGALFKSPNEQIVYFLSPPFFYPYPLLLPVPLFSALGSTRIALD